MRFTKVIFAISALALLTASCKSELEASLHEQTVIVNSPAGADDGVLLVKIKPGENLCEACLNELGAISAEPVFVRTDRNAAALHSEGLDRWVELRFDSKLSPVLMARKVKEAGIADCLEYSHPVNLESRPGKAVPFNGSTHESTKADLAASFDDPYLDMQWHYENSGNQALIPTSLKGADICAADAWRYCKGNSKVVVAVVDEGINYNHPDLKSHMWVNESEMGGTIGADDDNNGYKDDKYGYNFVKGVGTISWNNSGDIGHATHVAGTISAVNGNGIGVCGIAGGSGEDDGVRLMSLQIVMGSSSASTSQRARAYQYAADNGAVILQCSFGFSSDSITNDAAYENYYGVEADALRYFIKYAHNDAIDGGLVIFAAGNEKGAMSDYPGALYDCVAVTALAADGKPAYYTNYGPGCNVAAPGGEYYTGLAGTSANSYSAVLSTLPKDLYGGTEYGYFEGTSMACPHVSGVAALGLSYALELGKHYSAGQFRSMLLTSVDELDSALAGTRMYQGQSYNLGQYHLKMGSGSINAYKLLMQVEGTPWLMAGCSGKQSIDLAPFFGGNAANLTFMGVSASDEDMQAVGMAQKPVVSNGRLEVSVSRSGAVKFNISAIAGGSTIGGGNKAGGTLVEKTVAVIFKSGVAGNGAWL